MSDERREIPDPVLTPEDLSRTVQKAVDGVDDLYACLPHPLARHHLKREGVKDFIALVAMSHAALQDQVTTLAAEVERLTPAEAVAPVTEEKVEGVMAHLGEAVEEQPFASFPESESAVEAPTPLPLDFVSEHVAGLLRSADFYTLEAVATASDEELLAINGIGDGYLEDIRVALGEEADRE